MDESEYLSAKLSLPRDKVSATLALFAEGATVPFVARYRREVTGDMSDETLRKLLDAQAAYRSLEERRQTVLDSLAKQNITDAGLIAQVKAADTLSALEDIYRPYRPKRETRGSKAVKAGLDKLLNFIFSDRTGSLKEVAGGYVSEKYPTAEDCIQGALDIWAENISDRAVNRRAVRGVLAKDGSVVATLTKEPPEHTFDGYDSSRFPLSTIKPHQVLALSRGERLKCLKLSFDFPKDTLFTAIARSEKPAGFAYPSLLEQTVEDACERLIFPSVENEVWNELEEAAKSSSMEVFARGVQEILLAPPLKPQVVMGFDPGYHHGCKIAVIDRTGKVLDTAVVYPTIESQARIQEAARIVTNLVRKYGVTAIALGNGTASRESYDFLIDLFKDAQPPVQVCIVSESGASVYSVTPEAQREFPQYDVNLRSAVSIARRLLDPLAELVKIPPESLGVGQYQHDLDQKKLSAKLSDVVEDCVSSVGVDLNTASPALLEHVSGLNKRSAQSLVDYRNEHGRFDSRSELLAVKGFGPKAFTNAAGFLRISGQEPLDDTFIHPESYEVARRAITLLKIDGRETAAKLASSLTGEQLASYAKQLGTDQYTLKQILDELAVPHRDPRGEFQAPHFDTSIRSIADLKEGMVLEGTVRNVVAYGAYVDLGIHKDGLLHVSEMSDRSRRVDPSKLVHIGQILKVKVIGVDLQRNRISLSIKGLGGQGK